MIKEGILVPRGRSYPISLYLREETRSGSTRGGNGDDDDYDNYDDDYDEDEAENDDEIEFLIKLKILLLS